MKERTSIIVAVVLGLLLIGTASAGYAEDLKGKNQLEVIEYWLAEQPHSARGSYELMCATDAFTSKGFKSNTVSGDYAELKIWVANHRNEPKITRNNMVRINGGLIPD